MDYTYPEGIINAIDALCVELVKYYPDALNVKYGYHFEHHTCEESDFENKMRQLLYLELIRAGIIK